MSARRSDEITAAEADWGFTEDTDLMSALDTEARRSAAQWRLDADDVRQEFYLWLCAPDSAGRSRWRGLPTGIVLKRLREKSVRNERNKDQRRNQFQVDLHAEG